MKREIPVISRLSYQLSDGNADHLPGIGATTGHAVGIDPKILVKPLLV